MAVSRAVKRLQHGGGRFDVATLSDELHRRPGRVLSRARQEFALELNLLLPDIKNCLLGIVVDSFSPHVKSAIVPF